MAGRPKKPSHLKKLSGKDRDRNSTKGEIEKMRKVEDNIGGRSEMVTDVPENLSDLGKEYYSFIVNQMEVSGILKNLDIPIVSIASETLAIIEKCDQEIREYGLFYEEPDRNGRMIRKKNPAVDVRNKSVSEFKIIGTQLGMSPSSRTALAEMQIEKEEEQGDKLAQILNKKRG